MEPKQAWGAFSLVFVLADLTFVAAMYDLGYDFLPVAAVGLIALLVYFYVVYKRYHVEVVPEKDIALFDDADDLRILCRIYGLNDSGPTGTIRKRLLDFARSNNGGTFVWVAPRAVLGLGSALEVPTSEPASSPGGTESDILKMVVSDGMPDRAKRKSLLGGKARSSSRLSSLDTCSVCEAPAPRSGTVCSVCGADLEFYAVLSESRVGKRLLSEKAVSVKRKLRYDIPQLGETE